MIRMRTALIPVALGMMFAQPSSAEGVMRKVELHVGGLTETMESVYYIIRPVIRLTGEDVSDTCSGIEFDVTVSDPFGYVAPVTKHVALSPDEPITRVSADFGEVGGVMLTRISGLSVQGGCAMLSRTRIAGEDGTTAAEGQPEKHVGFTLEVDGANAIQTLAQQAAHAGGFHVGGEAETIQRVFFLKYGGTEVTVDPESACQGVEFDITSSGPAGHVANETTHVSLTPDMPLYRVDASFADFGGAILTEMSNLSVRGNCDVLTGGRVADSSGKTSTSWASGLKGEGVRVAVLD